MPFLGWRRIGLLYYLKPFDISRDISGRGGKPISKGGDVSVSQSIDPRTQSYVDQLRQTALGYAGIGGGSTAPSAASRPRRFSYGGRLYDLPSRGGETPYSPATNLPQATIDPALLDALEGYRGYADTGQMGLTALAGGSNPFLNPYLDALGSSYDEIRRRSLNTIGDQATLVGAFGGSRQGVAEGTALGELGREEALARIGIFDRAQDRAAQVAGLGLAGLGGQSELARYMQEYPQLFAGRQLGLLNAGMGPYGQTSTQHMSGDPFSQLLGLGTLFLPGGPLAGLFAKGAAGGALPMVV